MESNSLAPGARALMRGRAIRACASSSTRISTLVYELSTNSRTMAVPCALDSDATKRATHILARGVSPDAACHRARSWCCLWQFAKSRVHKLDFALQTEE